MNDPTPSAALAAVETWIFDLDNTLYSSASGLFPQIHKRMLEFVARDFGVGPEEAAAQRSRLFREYGTTMRGLMVERGTDPFTFMNYVHAIDLSCVDPDPRLDRALERLPGRKLIFTNASRDHAANVLGRLGLARHFDAVFDVEDCAWVPKPDAAGYRTLIERHGFLPARAAMVEDIPDNLIAAAALGMSTVWVREPHDVRWKDKPAQHDHVHHVTDDLVTWLDAVAG